MTDPDVLRLFAVDRGVPSLFAFSPVATIVPIGARRRPGTASSSTGTCCTSSTAFTGQWMTYVFAATPASRDDGPVLLPRERRDRALRREQLLRIPRARARGGGDRRSGPGATWRSPTSAGMVHGFSASKSTWASMHGRGAARGHDGQRAARVRRDPRRRRDLAVQRAHRDVHDAAGRPDGCRCSLERYVAVAVDGTTVARVLGAARASRRRRFAAPPAVDQAADVRAARRRDEPHGRISAPKGAFARADGLRPASMLQHRAQIARSARRRRRTPGRRLLRRTRNEWIRARRVAGNALPERRLRRWSRRRAADSGDGRTRGDSWIHQAAPLTEVAVAGTSPPNLAETFFARDRDDDLHVQSADAGVAHRDDRRARDARARAPRGDPRAGRRRGVRVRHLVRPVVGAAAARAVFERRRPGGSPRGRPTASASTGTAASVRLATITEFPDFYRASTLGSRFRIAVSGEPGAAMRSSARRCGGRVDHCSRPTARCCSIRRRS